MLGSINYHVPYANWHTRLVDFIEESIDGDTIFVHNESMLELAKSAISRMCPEKQIILKIEPPATDYREG